MRFKSRTRYYWIYLQKQKSFGPGQIYTALSRVKTYDNLYCTRKFKKSAIVINKDELFEYERLKQNDLFSTTKRNNISDHTIAVFVYNVRLLSEHRDDIVSDDRIINNDIIEFTESQINSWDFTCKIMDAYGSRNNVAILDQFDANAVFSFKEHASEW